MSDVDLAMAHDWSRDVGVTPLFASVRASVQGQKNITSMTLVKSGSFDRNAIVSGREDRGSVPARAWAFMGALVLVLAPRRRRRA